MASRRKHPKILLLVLLPLAAFGTFLFSYTQNKKETPPPDERVLNVSGGRITKLDPAFADSLENQYITAAFYDTPLQYDYVARPYKLVPGFLAEMPGVSADLKTYRLKLRTDIYFQDDPCFKDAPESRHASSRDLAFSLLRLADGRLCSPGYWLLRNKVTGIAAFRDASASAKPGDYSVYDKGCHGFETPDPYTLIIRLDAPDPRLLYSLAMPYAGLVSRRAVEFYGDKFAWYPVSSGPFILSELQRDYKMVLTRNPAYRKEYFAEAASEADRTRPLPLVDKIVCSLIKQPLSSWLLFLQGELDMSALDKDNFDAVVNDKLQLIPALAERKISLIQVPEFQVNYIGFSFTDPLLADNLKLRQAISLAYNVPLRAKHANYSLLPANGPIPPGVPGADPTFQNPWGKYDLERAKQLLSEAGYPNGIDPKTAKPLQLSFDQNGTSATHRQTAELMVNDMRKLGIEIKPSMNESPRFFKKLSDGQAQLFRLSWSGDYPDAENFLQLFYGPNAGSSNRVCYRDPEFDKMFAEIISMPDSPERTEKYRRMSVYLTEKCPWVFESYPVSYRMTHAWLENYLPHDFAFSRWKYLSLDQAKRTAHKASFRPITMKDLQK